MQDSFYHITYLKTFETYFISAPPYIFPQKCDVVYSNVITNDVICAPFVTTLLKRSGEAKLDIALVHLCDFPHCVPALLDHGLCDKVAKNIYCLIFDGVRFVYKIRFTSYNFILLI